MRPGQVLASTIPHQRQVRERGAGRGPAVLTPGSLPSLTTTHCTPGTTRLVPGPQAMRAYIQSLTLSVRPRLLPGAAQHSGKQRSAPERTAGPKQAAIHPGTHAEQLAVEGRAKARTIYLCCQATDSHLRTHLISWINTRKWLWNQKPLEVRTGVSQSYPTCAPTNCSDISKLNEI